MVGHSSSRAFLVELNCVALRSIHEFIITSIIIIISTTIFVLFYSILILTLILLLCQQ